MIADLIYQQNIHRYIEYFEYMVYVLAISGGPMYLEDHLEKLRYFYTVAQLGSMKKASEEIYITQPSLTKAIKILEDAVGHQLLERHPRGVSPTQRGEMLLQYCHELFASLNNLEQQLEWPDDPMAGVIRVGTFDSIGIYFWPKFLKNFLPKHPKLNLVMQTGRSHQMRQKLESGEIDVALIIEPKTTANIKVETFKTDTFKFYAAIKGRNVYKDNKDVPLILMPEAIAGNRSLKDVLTEHGLQDRRLYTSSSLESVKELTVNGIGVGLLPEMVAREALKKKMIAEFKQKPYPGKGIGKHTIGIAYAKTRSNSPLLKELIKELKASTW